MGPTERIEESQIEMAIRHPSTVEYKEARATYLHERRTGVVGQIRELGVVRDDLWGEEYQLKHEVARMRDE